jgi:hypothetical protein
MKITEELTAAIQDLVNEENPRFKREALDALVAFNHNLPARFTGTLAVLNPVVDLMLGPVDKFNQIAVLIETRRLAAGLPLLWPPREQARFDKRIYQANYMAERRRRAAQAVSIENAKRGERNPLEGPSRIEYERKVTSAGARERDRQVRAARASSGGHMSHEQTLLLRQNFWARVDEDLNRELDTLRRANARP